MYCHGPDFKTLWATRGPPGQEFETNALNIKTEIMQEQEGLVQV